MLGRPSSPLDQILQFALPRAFVEDTLGVEDLLSYRAQLLHGCSHLILIAFSVTASVCVRGKAGQDRRGADTQTRAMALGGHRPRTPHIAEKFS